MTADDKSKFMKESLKNELQKSERKKIEKKSRILKKKEEGVGRKRMAPDQGHVQEEAKVQKRRATDDSVSFTAS